ncbi:GspH/FimT family pseudopilin [Simiduia litorea]|uniref:GspH/FimT family pseudopilin n=1 Tax=Simiduia litorea TaxID=1435348 RepID=UPI0036F1EE82
MKKTFGFTIIELMMTLLIAFILIGAGVPALNDFVSDRSLASEISRFNIALSMARSEAITRGSNVVVCPSANGTSCVASNDWAGGWIVFRDVVGNGSPDLGDGTCAAASDCVLRFDQGMSTGGVLTANANLLSFNRTGERVGGSSTFFKICNPKAHQVRNITIAASGSVSIVSSVGVCP